MTHVYAGYADGTIKQWDLVNGNCVLHIDSINQSKNNKRFIWQLCVFESYLISGDSDGSICFWNKQFGTLVKSVRELQADI